MLLISFASDNLADNEIPCDCPLDAVIEAGELLKTISKSSL